MLKIQEKINNQVKVTFIWDNLTNGVLDFKDSPIDKGLDIFEQLFKNRVTLA